MALAGLIFTHWVVAQKVTISGNAPGNMKEVSLMAIDATSMDYALYEQVPVRQGSFKFRFDLDQPNLFKLRVGNKEVRLAISKASEIVITFSKDGVDIEGSQESLNLSLFEQKNGALQARHFGALKKEADEAMADGDKEALQKIQEKSAIAIQEFLVEFRAAIVEMGASPGGYYAIQFSDFNKEIDFIKERLLAFEQEIPESPVTKALAKQVYQATALAVGAVPPAITANDREGEVFNFNQYQGKVLLVDFWAAWCRACRIENPQFVDLYQEFGTKGLEIVSISQDEKKATWEAAIAKDGVGIWRQIQDADGRISARYSVSSLPQNVVVGKDGRIIARNVTAEQLRQLLTDHL